MPSDFKGKEPTKAEKMFYELAMQQQQMERALWSTSAHVVALGVLLGADPQKIAEIIVGGDDKIKEYSNKVNEAIKALEAKNPAHHHDHEGHDHEHEHEHHDHEHNHKQTE
jgi:hypothetical protein